MIGTNRTSFVVERVSCSDSIRQDAPGTEQRHEKGLRRGDRGSASGAVGHHAVGRSTAPADPSVLPISLQDARVPLRHPEILRRERK